MRRILLLFGIVVLASCEKDVDFKLNEKSDVLVVDASIENDRPPLVVLTRSLNYFSQISPEILANMFVHDAEILISNGTLTQKLKEYVVDPNAFLKIYYYSIDSSNMASSFLGNVNTSYSLVIKTGGKEYTAQTSIPSLRKTIDSVWWKPAAPEEKLKATVMVKLTDPKGFGDYMRYYTKRNREPFLPAENSVFDDFILDGTTYEVPVEPGLDRNNRVPLEDRSFQRGDTISIRLSNIDKATFDFWRTMEYSYVSIGNPFSTPVTVQSNIRGGALGYFGGYASQYRTLIIPK